MTVRWVLAVALLSSGCGVWRTAPRCESPEQVLASAGESTLTCADFDRALSYVESLAARTVSGPDRENLEGWLISAFTADPGATGRALAAADAATATYADLHGLPAAELRSEAVFAALSGAGPFGSDETALGVLRRAIGPWSTAAGDRLVLTEMDIEGWLRYASLCREAQGAGAMRLSVADRQVVYRLVIDAFDAADRRGKVAIVGVGAFWPAIKDAWAIASYDDQQAWIAAAPLPPPMTATSLGYAEALLGGPLTTHVVVLHEQLGPLSPGISE